MGTKPRRREGREDLIVQREKEREGGEDDESRRLCTVHKLKRWKIELPVHGIKRNDARTPGELMKGPSRMCPDNHSRDAA